MATKESIIQSIKNKVGTTQYNIWRIGLTHDIAERKRQWKDEGQDVSHWSDWEADSLSDAQDIESFFIRKGMKGGTGGDLSPRRPVFVYVF